MAQTPTPRSYAQILGDMIDAFLSRFGLRALKVGSPVLSMLESAAQSQLRASEDIFTLLEAISLDNAEGDALDRIGADEDVPRQTESPASGPVVVSDTSFTKVSSKVFLGTPAPIVGSTTINITDASLFTPTGSVYLGRGTQNYEGPIAYTSILPPGIGFGLSGGDYYSLVLSTGTLKFHNKGDSVILAQGGNRDILPGKIVQTPQGNVVNATQFKVLYKASIPDGETSVQGVTVVALKPGTTGNVSDGAISSFSGGDPFTGASVTNPSPFTNGLATESDDNYRERIRQARQSRARGTALALQTFALGVTSPDENKRTLSASFVSRQGFPGVLYIDDGTGYEERSTGVAIESFVDLALGGEQYFKVSSQPPVTKAFVLSTEVAPFSLVAGAQLAFRVGGVTTVHTFDVDEFRAIDNATAFEVVASINANPLLNWSARTYNSGAQVAVFAKADTNEDIQYDAGSTTIDGNLYLGFPVGRVYTMRLYKNDRLLTKDGTIASLVANPVSAWGVLGPTEDLELQVDGTPMANLAGGTFTFTGTDFLIAGTGYGTVSTNTPAAWAAVLNYRIPGITASVVNGLIVITSNLGAASRASLAILGGSLVSKGMFNLTNTPVLGAAPDYKLDRNTGEFKLTNPLSTGDRLATGTVNTRAFLESPALSPFTVTAAGAHLWWSIDGNAAIVPSGLTSSTTIVFSQTVEAWGRRERVTQNVGTGMFSAVAEGDWAVFWDPAAPADVLDQAFRVSAVATDGSWFEFDRVSCVIPGGPVTFTAAGLSFCRTTGLLQKTTLAPGSNYTASLIAPLLDAVLTGSQATVYRTTALRANTATFSDANGDIALVAADIDGQKLQIPVANATKNLTGHLASVESGNGETGTPDFHQTFVSSASGIGSQPTIDWTAGTYFATPDVSSLLVGLRPFADATTVHLGRYGNQNAWVSPISVETSAGGNTYNTTLRSLPYETNLNDRWYLANTFKLGNEDELAVLVDNDAESKRFVVGMARTLKTVGTTYGSTNTFKDGDNGNQSLAVSFGFGSGGFDFNDFAVYMPARVQTHLQGDATHYTIAPPDLTKTVLWRYYRLGQDGEFGRVRYVYPVAASTPVGLGIDNTPDQHTNIDIQLGSGGAKTGFPTNASNQIGVVVTTGGGTVASISYLLGLKVVSATRAANVTTLTLDIASVGATNHNIPNGSTVYVNTGSGTYPSGSFVLTGVAAATVSYADAGANAGPTVLAGTLTYGGSEATLTGASPAVVTGDYMRWASTTSLPAQMRSQTTRIASLPNPQAMLTKVETTAATNTVVAWYTMSDAAGLSVFAALNQTATAIVAAVNALDNPIVTGKVIGSGSGVISDSSSVEGTASPTWFNLADGANYVRTTTVPGSVVGDYQMLFKLPITANLATNSDWANEIVQAMPRTTKNVVDWLNAPAVSGLFSVCDIERSSRSRKIQIASLTPGSVGSVQVQGGTANSATASVQGTAVLAVSGSAMIATVPTIDLAGFHAGDWVSIDNTVVLPRPGVVDATTALQSIAASGNNWLIHTNTAWYTLVDNKVTVWSVERQGNFWCFTDTRLGSGGIALTIAEGDYVYIKDDSTYEGGGFEAVEALNAANGGTFRVVRAITSPDVGGVSFWIENTAGVDQAMTSARVRVMNADAPVPGDQLVISTPLWDGASTNQGSFTVVDVGNNGAGSYTDTHYVTVSGVLHAVGAPAAALGTSVNLVQVLEGHPARLIKHIVSIAPSIASNALSEMKFSTNELYSKVGATPGSIVTALDKFNFDTAIVEGVDGYQHSTGLIAEVNRVIYGDPADTITYPGVAAAGANVNIQGPLVKRIQVTISLRVRTGAVLDDIEAAVKSAVATVINQTGIGESISLSSLTTAAGKVGGVVSAVMVNPLATAGNDLISVQPFEKPLILNVDQDVLVTFVGA